MFHSHAHCLLLVWVQGMLRVVVLLVEATVDGEVLFVFAVLETSTVGIDGWIN